MKLYAALSSRGKIKFVYTPRTSKKEATGRLLSAERVGQVEVTIIKK